MTCGTNSTTDDEDVEEKIRINMEDHGIVMHHQYSLLGAYEFEM